MRFAKAIFMTFTYVSIVNIIAGQSLAPVVSTPEIRAIEATHYLDFSSTISISDLITLPENINKTNLVIASSPRAHHNIGGMPKDNNAWLGELIGNSELVVVGRPFNRISALNYNKTFLFSDYEFVIDEVLYDKSQLFSGSQVVVSRPGGVMSYEGKSVRAIDPEFQMFRLGASYILFLYKLPDTGTFMARADRSFIVDRGSIYASKKHPEHSLGNISKEGFLSLVRTYGARKKVDVKSSSEVHSR